MDVAGAKQGVRVAGRALEGLIDGIRKRFEARPALVQKPDAPPPPPEGDSWPDVEGCLAAVDSLVTALEIAGNIDASRPPQVEAAHLSRSSRRPEAPAELVSLSTLAATHTALELAAGWGVAVVCESRPLGVHRGWSRAAKLSIKAQRRVETREELPSEELQQRRQRLLETFARVMARPSLLPVAPRFATDLVALALHSDDLTPLELLPAAWVARSAREMLSSAQSPETRKRCGIVLAATARRSVPAVLDEFAGDDELSAETGGDAPAVVENVATALADSSDVDYVRDVAPQLISVALSDDAPRAKIAKLALAKLATKAHVEVLAAIAGNMFTHEPGDLVRFAAFAKLVTRDAIVLAGSIIDAALVETLWLVATFAATNSRKRDLADATAALAAMASGAGADALAKALDSTVFQRSPAVAIAPSLDTGGLRIVPNDEAPSSSGGEDNKDIVLEVLRSIDSPAVVGAIFAATLRSHLLCEGSSLPRMQVAATVAELLDAGAIETSGVSILSAVSAVLEARSKTVAGSFQFDDNEDSEEDETLEQVALGTLLAILTVGSSERPEDEEAALRTTLPSLEILANPSRRHHDLAQLASECWVQVLTRGGNEPVVEQKEAIPDVAGDWREALASAREALQNASPAERARAIVSVTKFARAVTRDREAQHREQKRIRLLDDEQVETTKMPSADDWRPVALACVEALGDDESYVYLAAAHSLAALADANPQEVMKFLTSEDALETVDKRDRVEARLAEALSVSIRRRGDAAPIYVERIGRRLVLDARPGSDPRTRCAAFANLADLVAQSAFSLKPIVLDVLDLVTTTFDLEPKLVHARSYVQKITDDPGQKEQPKKKPETLAEAEAKATFTFSARRAAAYLGCRLMEGSAKPCIEAAPRPTAKMCRKLGTLAEDITEDPATRYHGARAIEALDTCLQNLLPADEVLPMFRANWLATDHPNRFDFVTDLSSS